LDLEEEVTGGWRRPHNERLKLALLPDHCYDNLIKDN
jgi:hypothetical protein